MRIKKGIVASAKIGLPIAIVILIMIVPFGVSSEREAQAFLRRYFNFSATEFNALDRGEVITRLPPVPDSREVAVLGAVKVNVSKDIFVARIRDIANFKRSSNVLEIGRFGKTPKLDDLRGLTIDEDDINALRECRVGDCGVKLSAAWINRLQKGIDWNAPDYQIRASTMIKQMLVEYAQGYLAGGNARLGVYQDKEYAHKVADDVVSLLRKTQYIYNYAPDFLRYLEQFPQSKPAGVEDFIYWSKEKFGLKPVISLTHISIYRKSRTGGTDLFIASKQLYASHYFESSLGFTYFLDDTQNSREPAAYVIYLNRSRADGLRGRFSDAKRRLIAGELRDGMEKNLNILKERLSGPRRSI
ncbi:MAG: hypothetical protein IPL01_04580 [Acidobacteria bacterium]|nr:hypothetical protein [Acidobacteriota bacterium]